MDRTVKVENGRFTVYDEIGNIVFSGGLYIKQAVICDDKVVAVNEHGYIEEYPCAFAGNCTKGYGHGIKRILQVSGNTVIAQGQNDLTEEYEDGILQRSY